MDSLASANEALTHLNNTQLLEDGTKMSVHLAALEKIIFKQNNTGGVGKRWREVIVEPGC